jgi:hypothetical protein
MSVFGYRKKDRLEVLFFGFALCLFGGSQIYQRATIDLNGSIVSSETRYVPTDHNRCITQYIVEQSDHSHTIYVGGSSPQSLPCGLPVGTAISKTKWSLSYSVNGRRVNDFSTGFYVGVIVIGLCSIGWWRLLYRGGT